VDPVRAQIVELPVGMGVDAWSPFMTQLVGRRV
jgi:hypothetical protein